MLTKRQKECLDFIDGYVAEHLFSPTLDEISAGIGAAHRGDVHRILDQLEDRGFIERTRGKPTTPYALGYTKARGIVVLKSSAPPIPIYDADTLQLRGYLP